jgi:hypothetical protein
MRIGRLCLFWEWGRTVWGLFGPMPFLPYDWRLYLGPFAACWATQKAPTKWTRQRRRAFERQLRRASR